MIEKVLRAAEINIRLLKQLQHLIMLVVVQNTHGLSNLDLDRCHLLLSLLHIGMKKSVQGLSDSHYTVLRHASTVLELDEILEKGQD